MKVTAVGAAALALPMLGLPAGPEMDRDSSDVLNGQTQQAIRNKALSVIRYTPDGAAELADRLRNGSYSSADNICGPLAAFQLIGTVIYGVRPEDFWLANAREIDKTGRTDIFSRAFPDNKFDNFQITSPIADFDFGALNLQPGDFLYFMAGKTSGSDHMVTVSRRDKDGILWAMTNYPNQDKKFVVIEVPVWDPKNPGASFVKDLAKGKNSVGFSSGQGGFMLWRLKNGETSAYDLFDQAQEARSLQNGIEETVRSAQGKWNVVVADMDSDKIIAESSSRMLRQSASVIKVPVAMCVLSVLESKVKSGSELADYLKNMSLKDATFDQLFTRMLVNSDEESTGRLTDFLVSQKVDTGALLTSWGMGDTNLFTRVSTEEDIKRSFASVYNIDDGRALRFPYSHGYLLNLLSGFSADHTTRFGALSGYGVKVNRVYDKIGSVAGRDLSIVADAGVIEVRLLLDRFFPINRSYFISVNGQPKRGSGCDYKTLETEFSGLMGQIAKYLNGK